MKQGVDGPTKKIDNLIEGVKSFVAEGISQIVPNMFHGVKFWAVRQQGKKDHVFWDS
jgi:hypothetical protein